MHHPAFAVQRPCFSFSKKPLEVPIAFPQEPQILTLSKIVVFVWRLMGFHVSLEEGPLIIVIAR